MNKPTTSTSFSYETFKKYFVIVLSLFTAFLHIAKFTFLPMESIRFYAWHLMLGLIFLFLYYPASKKKNSKLLLFDWLLITLTAAIFLYVICKFNHFIVIMQTNSLTPPLLFCGIILTLIVFEATRRTLGWALPVIAIIAIAYAMYGGGLPGFLGHRGYSYLRVSATIFSDQGLLGTPIAVSATNVFLFLMFGSFLSVSGADKIFQDIAIALTGKKRGGPAKMAVFAAAFFGMISGSAVANVVSTGSFTIPLMKRQNYSNRFAGAVTAVASTGGQIMPPIMGAAAFVLADIVGMSYGVVCLAALLPAVMYYLTLFKMVDLEAVKREIGGIAAEDLPDLKSALLRGFTLFIPLAVLLFCLLILKVTPMLSAIYSIAAIIVLGLVNRKGGMSVKDIVDGFVASTKALPQVVAACACSGIVTGIFALTGFGLKISDVVVNLGGTNILLSLILAMLICIVLGMGLPTTAAYIICATAVAPALVSLGLPKIAAHLFLLYFASISAITPPVAVASYAAAGLADENAVKVGLTGCKIGIAGFILPFAFALNPDYLHTAFDVLTLFTWISGIIVSLAAAVCVQGYIEKKITWVERLLCFAAICLAIQSNYFISVAGWLLFAAVYIYRKLEARQAAQA